MKIIIPGEPIPQGRMRHRSTGKFVLTYDPCAKQKAKIRTSLSQVLNPPIFEFPRISFLFLMPIPKSIPKKDLPKYSSGRLKHIKKPDVDNLIKLYLDCLDGIIIFGDQKVSLGPCLKIYSPEPKTFISITETTQCLAPWELEIDLLISEEPDKSSSYV